ncbi:MAG TPA: hypothetical protein VMH91_01035 [Candidatus Paceibacterota bacterium]|nr:hypothetical protein [Candidatus Paceibacterota bacterium]
MTDDEMIAPGGEPEKKEPQSAAGVPPIIPLSAEMPPSPTLSVPPPVENASPSVIVPAPSPAPAPPSAPTTPTTGVPLKDNIARILEDVKLPERRDFKASADTKSKQGPEPEAAILEERIVKTAAPRSASSTPTPTPASVSAPTTPEKEVSSSQSVDFSSIVAPLRTLKDDLETVVREKKISLVRAATLEEEKKHGQEHLTPEPKEVRPRGSRRAFGVLFFSGVLIALGAGALFGVFFIMKEQAAVPSSLPQSSILFSEQTVAFPLGGQTSQSLKSALAQASGQQLGQLGSITRVVPTIAATSSGQQGQVSATLSQFFSALGIQAPKELMGAVGPDFFFGFHVVDTNAPLFVIPVTSYDHAFAGMLAWEPTMDDSLTPVFKAVSATKLDANGIPETRTFEDDVLRNYDVRELKDDSGTVVLYYSFPTPNILVIAQSPYSFTEILSRLQAQREL